MTESSPFSVLSKLLQPYAKKMIVKHNTDSNFYLEETLSSDKPQMFGAAQIKKNYTSFHLFPVYCHPELLTDISDELRKRMQGKSCFNFKNAEQVPVTELKKLVKRAFETL
ncbi:MAG: hypothetical protein AB8G18_01065 [Gammaproteobacteria bacterium]